MNRAAEIERRLLFAAVIAATAAAIAWLIVPAYATETVAERNGDWVYALLALPVAITVLPVAIGRIGRHRHRCTVISAWLLTGFCLITGFTVGLFYLPAALLLAAAAWAGRSRPEPRSV